MKKRINLLFIIAGIGGFLFFFIPLALRIPFIYNLVELFLSTFPNSEYKGVYFETVGALWGAFLGVSGAVWVQGFANRQLKSAEIEKNAQIINADLNDSMKRIKDTLSGFQTIDFLHADEKTREDFAILVKRYRIIELPDWKQKILSIEPCLPGDEIRLLFITYTSLAEISLLSNSFDSASLTKLSGLMRSIEKNTDSLQQLMAKLNSYFRWKKK